MVVGDLVYNDDFDCNCNYDIYDCSDGKQYGDGAELIFCTKRDGFNVNGRIRVPFYSLQVMP